MATAHDARTEFNEKKKRQQDLHALEGEETSREKRIEDRKRQQKKVMMAKAAAKKKRALKLATVWFSLFIVGVFTFGWFSDSLIPWFHKLLN